MRDDAEQTSSPGAAAHTPRGHRSMDTAAPGSQPTCCTLERRRIRSENVRRYTFEAIVRRRAKTAVIPGILRQKGTEGEAAETPSSEALHENHLTVHHVA